MQEAMQTHERSRLTCLDAWNELERVCGWRSTVTDESHTEGGAKNALAYDDGGVSDAQAAIRLGAAFGCPFATAPLQTRFRVRET